jgi:hypothetical protein
VQIIYLCFISVWDVDACHNHYNECSLVIVSTVTSRKAQWKRSTGPLVGCCSQELNATHPGQGLEELRFKLRSLVCGQLKRDIQLVSRAHATVLAVMSEIGMTSGQQVKRLTPVRQYV